MKKNKNLKTMSIMIVPSLWIDHRYKVKLHNVLDDDDDDDDSLWNYIKIIAGMNMFDKKNDEQQISIIIDIYSSSRRRRVFREQLNFFGT